MKQTLKTAEIVQEIISELKHDFNLSEEGEKTWRRYLTARISTIRLDAMEEGIRQAILTDANNRTELP